MDILKGYKYDSWKLATPPYWEDDDPDYCTQCGEELGQFDYDYDDGLCEDCRGVARKEK